MKRFFLLILWCGLFFPVISCAQTGDQAEVTYLSGNVTALLQSEQDYIPAEENMLLEQGDKIRTGSNSSVELSFNDENTNLVRLSENTDLNIVLRGDEKLEMSQGEVFATVSKLPGGSAFEIHTPTAVSGARGTDWVTKVSEEGTDVEAIDSISYVRHFKEKGVISDEATMIHPGNMTTVRMLQRPVKPKPIMPDKRMQWQSMKKEINQRGQQAVVKRQQKMPFDRGQFLKQMKDKKSGLAGGENPHDNKPMDKSHAPLKQFESDKSRHKENKPFNDSSMPKKAGDFKPRKDISGQPIKHDGLITKEQKPLGNASKPDGVTKQQIPQKFPKQDAPSAQRQKKLQIDSPANQKTGRHPASLTKRPMHNKK